MDNEKVIALLIDAENVSPKYIKTIIDEVSGHGTPAYKRIYGDWTSVGMSSWKQVLLEYNLTPIQQFSYTQGKNASDSAMIIDAMDILYAKNIDGFCIVSSDSDFTRLASRLRESRMTVIGMGESKTPTAFKAACDTFKYLDVLMQLKTDAPSKTPIKKQPANKKPETPKELPETQDQQTATSAFVPLEEVVAKITEIIDLYSEEDGYMPLSQLGIMLSRIWADFDSRNYGFPKLRKLVDSTKAYETMFEQLENGSKNLLVRNK